MATVAEWQQALQDMLRHRDPPTDAICHRYLGIHFPTLVSLWKLLARCWPYNESMPLERRRLLWALWFLRDYPTYRHVLEMMRSANLFYSSVWLYVLVIAHTLPQVSNR